MSPTILEADGYRFFFYSREFSGGALEPPHVHIRKGGAEAKVWIDSAQVAYAHGFSPSDERAIRDLVMRNRAFLRQAWDEYFREPPSEAH